LPLPRENDYVEFARWALPEHDSATRHVLAAWTVGKALGCDLTDDAWNARTLVTPYGTRVDVKAAAYLHAWEGVGARGVRYDRLRPKLGTSAAQVYVLGLHTAITPEAYNLWDCHQWEWRVVPRCSIDQLDQSSVGLARLQDLDTCALATIEQLPAAVEHAAEQHRARTADPDRSA